MDNGLVGISSIDTIDINKHIKQKLDLEIKEEESIELDIDDLEDLEDLKNQIEDLDELEDDAQSVIDQLEKIF